MCNLMHLVDKIQIYRFQYRGVHGNGKSHWNVIPMGMGIAIIREMGIQQRKKAHKRLDTKLPLNDAVPAEHQWWHPVFQ